MFAPSHVVMHAVEKVEHKFPGIPGAWKASTARLLITSALIFSLATGHSISFRINFAWGRPTP